MTLSFINIFYAISMFNSPKFSLTGKYSTHLKTCQYPIDAEFKLPIKIDLCFLALGAESAGVFAVYKNGGVFVSENFGDLLEENNFSRYKKAVFGFLKKEKTKPRAIITDLHPLYRSSVLGNELSQKLKIPQIKVQHHIAHIFSAVGDCVINSKFQTCPRETSGIPNSKFNFIGIAADGTGYGFDGNIWGGEMFKVQSSKHALKRHWGFKVQSRDDKLKIGKSHNLIVKRIGSLEEQTMIGGDLSVKEPARMIIAILAKIPNPKLVPERHRGSQTCPREASGIPNLSPRGIGDPKSHKDFIHRYVNRFYTRNEFELLYNQLEQGFNCQKTTSAGRVLDAVSVLLGFAGNKRNYKHEAVKKLEENSTIPYKDINSRIMNYESRKIVDTTFLFEYLLKNIKKDKRRLAATAQLYIAKGFYEIVKKNIQYPISNIHPVFFAGGLSNNKIISQYLEERGIYLSKKIPRGDEGIAIGQLMFALI